MVDHFYAFLDIGLAPMSSRKSSSFRQSWGTKWLVLGSVRLELALMSQVGLFLQHFPIVDHLLTFFCVIFFRIRAHTHFFLTCRLYMSFCYNPLIVETLLTTHKKTRSLASLNLLRNYRESDGIVLVV